MAVATLTDFLRTPKRVVADTEKGAVRITRRGADDLMLVKAVDLEEQQLGVALASRLLRAKMAAGSMAEGLTSLFAWTGLFDPADVDAFAGDMERQVWAAAELGRYHCLLREFRRWEATAEALADGFGPDDALDWLAEPVPVPKP